MAHDKDYEAHHDDRSVVDLLERLLAGGVTVERPEASPRHEQIRAAADDRRFPKPRTKR